MKTLWIAICLVLSGCATVPRRGPASTCGDPCAARACPGAFVCIVDSSCAARCVAEPMQPGSL